jgi:hypothetical protein
MARRKATIYLDEEVLRGMRVLAARTGKRDSQVVEEALRRFLGIDALEAAWGRSSLGEDEALQLAYSELHKARR